MATTKVAKAKVNLPVDISAAQAAEVALMKKRINAPSGDKIKTKNKVFTLPDGTTGDSMECIVVDFVTANKYYPSGYVEGNPLPPSCFALGLEQSGLTPSENSVDKQCESCAACWANQFKSHANGKGKACKNERVLAVLPLDADVDTPLAILEVTPTGLTSFDAAVTKAANANKPIRSFVTRVTFAQDATYPSVRFELIGLAGKDMELMAQSRKDEAMTRLLTEPDTSLLTAQAANDPRKKKPANKLLKRG